MSQGPNIARQNGVYKTIKQRVPAGSIVQPNAYLRLHQPAVNGRQRYIFPIQKNVGNSAIHERKLDQNDSFVATHLGFYLMAEDPTTPGVGVLQTYPNPVTFPAESNNVITAHLETFYNGSLYAKVDDKVFSDGMLLAPTRKVGTTQGAPAIASITAAFQNEKEGWDGIIEISPMLTLDGSKKTEIAIDVPAFSGQQVQYVTAPAKTTLVLILYGFLATGASNIGQIDITQ